MNYTKNNIGIVTTLILVILLSQSRFFDFLAETPFGRMILLALIIIISYVNKYLGLLSVLIVIIAFNNNSNMVYAFPSRFEGYEGFEPVVNKKNDNKQSMPDTNIIETSTITTTMNNSENSIPKESFKGREGFCMSDRELNILRGKQSNTISVFSKAREQIDEVEPSDKLTFTSDYALF